jgi:alpha-galactosidase
MKELNISMLGAGSGFVINIAKDLLDLKCFDKARFVLMDTNQTRLDKAFTAVCDIIKKQKANVEIVKTTELNKALDGIDYVIASCEQNRYPFWKKDIEIPEQFGVNQITGENGGPGGILHAMRNISLFMDILKGMEKYCPDALLMNFTNPMSFLCTYFKHYSKNKALGFCHQVHGSFGVIAEELGFGPGDLEVISGGVNHFNWLVDIRKRGCKQSFKTEFFEMVKKSQYWQKMHKNIPDQRFTLEILETLGEYCIGFDGHIIEYIPFFYEKNEWDTLGFESIVQNRLIPTIAKGEKASSLNAMTLIGEAKGEYSQYPFPKEWFHPYYAEKPCQVIRALETNELLYLDAINIVNNGSIENLPDDAIVDIPAIVKGGQVRGVHVGKLPMIGAELCRRQITIHEMIAKATHEGDDKLVLQALCLDPYVKSITQAKNIWQDFRKEYIDYLPTFKK